MLVKAMKTPEIVDVESPVIVESMLIFAILPIPLLL
jgi:hypothetical protein